MQLVELVQRRPVADVERINHLSRGQGLPTSEKRQYLVEAHLLRVLPLLVSLPVGQVDQGRGASPVGHDVEGDELVVEFPAGETGLEAGDDAARLFGKTEDGVAVLADVDVNTV